MAANPLSQAIQKLNAASAGGLASSALDAGYLGNGTPVGSGQSPFGYGPLLSNVAANVVAAAGTQVTCPVLPAQTNIILVSGTNYGVVLPNIVIGTISVVNADLESPLLVYPPEGGNIDGLGTNEPYTLPALYSRVSFTTCDSSVAWFAGVAPAQPAITAQQVFAAFSQLSSSQQQGFAQAVIASLPTTPTGLTVGQVWNDGGIPAAVVSL